VAHAVSDFVYSEGSDLLQIPVFEAIIDHPLDRTVNRVPRSPEALGGLLPAQALGPGSQEMAIDITAGVLALGPGHLLDFDAAIPAIDATHGVGEIDENAPDRNELEKAGRGHLVISRGGLGAARASGLAVGPGADLSDDDLLACLVIEFDAFINESLERMDGVE